MKEHMCKSGCECCGHNGTVSAIGRVLLGALFLVLGWGMLMNFNGTVGFVGSMVGSSLALPATVIMLFLKLVGGLMLVSGFHARVGAWMLILFTVIATYFGHNIFMPASDPAAAYNNFIMFWKNLAIIGGLLYVTAYGAGSYSLSYLNSKFCMGGKMCPDCKEC